MTRSEVVNPQPVNASKHMHSLEEPLQLPQGAEALASEALNAFSSWSIIEPVKDKTQKVSSAVGLERVDKTERHNERNAVFAAGGFHPVDRGPEDAVDAVKFLKSWQYEVTGQAAAAQVLADMKADHIKSGGPVGMINEAVKMINDNNLDDTFYIVDLGNVTRMFKAWQAAMPSVTPHYAVKCNPDPGLVKLLAQLGAGFDCASKGECEMILRLGVDPSRIIFAHPCKRPCDIRFAKENGIVHTTFDTASELHKMAAMNPAFKCVLRIRADDPEARVPLGLKYGCDVDDAPGLLQLAHSLNLDVVGVSFHVGSACKNTAVFSNAIQYARNVFDEAIKLGFDMELLDIGGGFSGRFDHDGKVEFGELAGTINAAIEAHFPPESGVRVIAEPGRYFAESSSTLFTPVYGQREKHHVNGSITKEYYITDGLYGSFNCIIYDGQNPEFQVVRAPGQPELKDTVLYKSTLWGPTCDSADCVYKDIMLPELQNGDWLMFPYAGAYTVAGACDFNGIEFTKPSTFYVYSDSAVDVAAYEVEEMIA